MQAIPNVRRFGLIGFCVAAFATIILFADQIDMTNGDRYNGKLISVSESDVKFQSEVQGVIKLPREKVSLISFGNKPVVSRSAVPAVPEAASVAIPSGAVTNIVDPLQVQGIDPKLLEKVRSEYLSDSGPEATDLFNRMVNGLISNKLSVNDIQSQAKSVLAELDDLKKDFDDPDIGGLLNQYGSILQTFLNQMDAGSKSMRTNSMPKLQKTPAALK